MVSETQNAKVGFAFCLFGIPVFLFGLAWISSNISFFITSHKISATVVDSIEKKCHGTKTYNRYSMQQSNTRFNSTNITYTCWQPVVNYSFQGKTYRSPLKESSSHGIYPVGQTRILRVNSKRPDQPATTFSLTLPPLLLIFIGALFGGFGVRFIASYRLKRKVYWHLIKNGVVSQAKVLQVGFDKMTTRKNRNPYYIVAQFKNPNSHVNQVFVRSTTWEDPHIKEISKENTIPVLYDPKDPEVAMIFFTHDSVKKVS